MNRKAALLAIALSALTCAALAQGAHWEVRIIFPKTDFLPGEPITVRLEAENLGPGPAHFHGFFDGLYLDGSAKQCGDRHTTTVEYPPKGSAIQRAAGPGDPVGTLHKEEVQLDVACASISGQPGLLPARADYIGPHRLCYRTPAMGDQPAMEGCAEFTVARPIGADARAYGYFKGEPLKHGEEMIKKFPSSNYAALALWKKGNDGYQGMKETGAEKDLTCDALAQTNYGSDLIGLESARNHIRGIIAPWEQLYTDFPAFPYRAELLYRLARCYLRVGEPSKATPLLRELLSKSPDSEPGKKAAGYRDVLKAHELWPKE